MNHSEFLFYFSIVFLISCKISVILTIQLIISARMNILSVKMTTYVIHNQISRAGCTI